MSSATVGLRPAQLLDDRGAAAVSERSFFRSRTHYDAEGVTHTLVLSAPGTRCAVPLVVRPIPGTGLHDAASPYGYPGGDLDGTPPDAADLDLSGTGLVSVFVREPIARPSLSGGTRRGTVLVHDPFRPRSTSRSFRRALRAARSAGYTPELLYGPDVDDTTLAGFAAAYAHTMNHVGATDRYRFGAGYLRGCLGHDGSWLAVVRDGDGRVAAGELVVRSDGILHSYLAATGDDHRHASPGKLCTARLLDLADELAMPLNHGGGVRPGDGLEASKRSYCNAEMGFVTHELVADEDTYDRLCRDVSGPSGDYFPGYRRRPGAPGGADSIPRETT
ncbi:GNAT family N-acetyltransferase [Pseudonocardia nematodicida]|uniref:GNAT family N-acetyltransferase n=1 Tax=Pseudonocardia nematodicida TaxID=1206997 RepID=A0ABV1K3R8_9PSEU